MVDGDIVMNSMQRIEILDWLTESDPARLEDLFHRADEVRRQHVGDAVHLRGLIELSNHCRRRCVYCGLRRKRHRGSVPVDSRRSAQLCHDRRVAGLRDGRAPGGRRS